MARPYIEIHASDIGASTFRAFGRVWLQGEDLPRLLARDIGKRIVLVGDIVQMENDEQLARRLANEQ